MFRFRHAAPRVPESVFVRLIPIAFLPGAIFLGGGCRVGDGQGGLSIVRGSGYSCSGEMETGSMTVRTTDGSDVPGGSGAIDPETRAFSVTLSGDVPTRFLVGNFANYENGKKIQLKVTNEDPEQYGTRLNHCIYRFPSASNRPHLRYGDACNIAQGFEKGSLVTYTNSNAWYSTGYNVPTTSGQWVFAPVPSIVGRFVDASGFAVPRGGSRSISSAPTWITT